MRGLFISNSKQGSVFRVLVCDSHQHQHHRHLYQTPTTSSQNARAGLQAKQCLLAAATAELKGNYWHRSWLRGAAHAVVAHAQALAPSISDWEKTGTFVSSAGMAMKGHKMCKGVVQDNLTLKREERLRTRVMISPIRRHRPPLVSNGNTYMIETRARW